MEERSRSSGLVRPRFGSSLDWLVVAFGVVLAGIHLYLGVVDRTSPFVVVGLGFLVGVSLFVTRFWRPVVYLLGVVYALTLGVIWVLDGVAYPAFGVATGVISTAFVVVAVYRFVREARRSPRG